MCRMDYKEKRGYRDVAIQENISRFQIKSQVIGKLDLDSSEYSLKRVFLFDTNGRKIEHKAMMKSSHALRNVGKWWDLVSSQYYQSHMCNRQVI